MKFRFHAFDFCVERFGNLVEIGHRGERFADTEVVFDFGFGTLGTYGKNCLIGRKVLEHVGFVDVDCRRTAGLDV